MSSKQLTRIWPLLVLAGIPVSMYIGVAIYAGELGLFNLEIGFGVYKATWHWIGIYALLAHFALLLSLLCWFGSRSKRSMFWSAVIGWVFCGFPGMGGILIFLESLRY